MTELPLLKENLSGWDTGTEMRLLAWPERASGLLLGGLLPRLLQDLVVREERQALGEGGNVHDGHGARHLGRRGEEGELGDLAVGGAGVPL